MSVQVVKDYFFTLTDTCARRTLLLARMLSFHTLVRLCLSFRPRRLFRLRLTTSLSDVAGRPLFWN